MLIRFFSFRFLVTLHGNHLSRLPHLLPANQCCLCRHLPLPHDDILLSDGRILGPR